MAEKLLAHALAAEPEPLKSIKVVSAGVAAGDGMPASRNAVTALQRVHLDLTQHRSQQVTDELLRASDWILAMTEGHRDTLFAYFPDLNKPVLLFRERLDSTDARVPDPYGGPLQEYLETRDSLAEAIPSIIQWIKSTL
ncbi:MAG: low molecular weight protein arginine phosphatase [Verrucomicrobia bacterium]|nr:low molecular weight protein arginine phosphatase [Verrucomicrobiota bacterium]